MPLRPTVALTYRYCALVREAGGGRPVETGQYSINAAQDLRIYSWVLKSIIFTFTSAVLW